VLATPVGFSGWTGPTRQPHELDEIRIGVFAPAQGDHPIGGPLHKAASLAIEQINISGGFEGVPLRLVSRWSDDPWRGGSKEMIKLVYEDSVWAVIGSVDGATTHVAEQVVTKAWLPLLSPISADPTLTYIRIPWMFRLPPNDETQAVTIVHDGIQARSLSRVGLISSVDHDGRIFAEEMLKRLGVARLPPAFHLQLSPVNADLAEVARYVQSFRPDGLIVRLLPAEITALLGHLHDVGVEVPAFIPWIPGLSQSELMDRYGGDVLCIQPFAQAGNPAYEAFAHAYQHKYHSQPTPGAAYAYDAVNMLVAAMRESGLNRSRLRDALYEHSGFRGVTGQVAWDNAGGNRTKPVLQILHATR
jgi:ABC-type branched-subunit amino acid transport system substrate-binding protein